MDDSVVKFCDIDSLYCKNKCNKMQNSFKPLDYWNPTGLLSSSA